MGPQPMTIYLSFFFYHICMVKARHLQELANRSPKAQDKQISCLGYCFLFVVAWRITSKRKKLLNFAKQMFSFDTYLCLFLMSCTELRQTSILQLYHTLHIPIPTACCIKHNGRGTVQLAVEQVLLGRYGTCRYCTWKH